MEGYRRASSVNDAIRLLQECDGHAEIIAGGQTLMLNIRQGLKQPDLLVDISGIDRLDGISDESDSVRIGGATTYSTIRKSEILTDRFPLLSRAMENIAGPQVRHNGTIGGGLCYGDPALDSPPVLLALDAEVVLEREDGTRRLPLSEFFVGYYMTDLQENEILTHIDVPDLPDWTAGCYRTMAPRQGDYAIAGVATRLSFADDKCKEARIALTNAGDTPMRVADAEEAIEGTEVTGEAVERAVKSVDDALDVIGDEQVSKSYKETIFRRLTKYTIDHCTQEVSA